MDLEIKTSYSQDKKEIVPALVKVQSTLKPAVFNKVNPHFKNRYADFSACLDTCRMPLVENGIALTQSCETINDKLYLVTMLTHISGQWVKSEFPLISAKMDSQGIGSAMTYAKRYSLCGLLSIVADEDDDDGEAAVGRGSKTEKKAAVKAVEEVPVEDVKEYIDKYLNIFDKEDKMHAMEYLKKVMSHFKWTEIATIKELLKDEKKLFERFNAWKSKIKKTEEA